MPKRSRLQTDERRAQLLELGIALFGARSYEEVSIDDIAAEAGISKGLLYHYFGGKRDFYVACLEVVGDQLVDGIREAIGPHTRPDPESARRGLHAYLAFVEARAEPYAALMHGGLGSDVEVQAIIEAIRSAFVAMALEPLGDAASSRAFHVAVRSWLGAVEAASLEWLPDRSLTRDELVDLLLPVLAALLMGAGRLAPTVAKGIDWPGSEG